jgi:hypothetical protein
MRLLCKGASVVAVAVAIGGNQMTVVKESGAWIKKPGVTRLLFLFRTCTHF